MVKKKVLPQKQHKFGKGKMQKMNDKKIGKGKKHGMNDKVKVHYQNIVDHEPVYRVNLNEHLVDTLQLQFEDQIIMNGWMALTIFLFSFLFGGISAFMLSKIKQEITAWNQKKEERNDAGNDEESQTNYQLMEDEATVQVNTKFN